jgi:hypothetical protein
MNGKNPTMLLKIPTYRGKILLEVYNQQKKLINMNKVCANDEMIAIIKFSGLRFLKQQFIAEWEIYKIKLLKVIDEDNLPSGYFFSDETDVNVEPLEALHQEKSQEEPNIFFNLEEEPQIKFINDNNINKEQLDEQEPQQDEEQEIQQEPQLEEEQEQEIQEEPQLEEEQEPQQEPQLEEEQEPQQEPQLEEEQEQEIQEEPQQEPQLEEEQEQEIQEEPQQEPQQEEEQQQEETEKGEQQQEDNKDTENDTDSEYESDYEFTDSEYELDLDDDIDELTLIDKTNKKDIDNEKQKKIELLLKAKQEQEAEIARIQQELENINN